MEIRETQEDIEKAHERENKRAALLITALAVALAITEMAGKEAQFSSITANIELSDTYAFYQAKTVRWTLLRTAVESAGLLPLEAGERVAQRDKQVEAWKSTVDRLESDPKSGEGRKELLERAKEIREIRDHKVHAYHAYEYAAGALQLGIVMASAAVITEVVLLEFVSAGLGLVGLAFGALGWLMPDLLPL